MMYRAKVNYERLATLRIRFVGWVEIEIALL